MSKKRLNCRTIDTFFTTPAKKKPPIPIELQDQQLQKGEKELLPSSSSSLAVDDGSTQKAKNDIGLFNKESVIDDFTKKSLLEDHWQPSASYQLPFSEHNVSFKDGSTKTIKRFLAKSHIDDYHWLVFSPSRKGLYCKYCAIFAHKRTVGHNKGMSLGKLVLEPLQNYKNLKGKESDLEKHQKHDYHKQSVLEAKAFLKTYHTPTLDIANQISSQRHKQVQENRERLKPIIESIIFLGRQNIPLRGHRDDGSLNDDASPEVNHGNFRELLQYRIAAGDTKLESHLTSASSRATYISKSTQNEIIKTCGEEIRDVIVSRIKKARFYSVLFDETTDISNIEQLSLSVRYVHAGNLYEDFITFVDAYELALKDGKEHGSTEACIEPKLSGEALGKIVINLIRELGLDINQCVGIGTDSCSVMSSEAVGAVRCIQETAKNACRSPCSNHALNNSISKSSSLPVIRNAVGTVKATVSFFNASAKRHIIFKDIQCSKLISLCETRWVERHEALIKFRDLLLPVIEALTKISQWQDRSTSSNANSLMNSIFSSDFVIGLLSLIDLLKETLPLSRYLQSPTLDVSKAADCFNRTLLLLNKKRQSSETSFNRVYSDAVELSNDMGFEIQLPRIASRQTHRENYPANTAEEYYLRSLYIPLLDNVIEDLKERLPETTMTSFKLRVLMPDCILEHNDQFKEEAKTLARSYSTLLLKSETTMASELEGELNHWFEFWKTQHERAKPSQHNDDKYSKMPKTVLEVLEKCDIDIYPTVRNLLIVLATLPVSVATSERTFSTLRRAKTWLRSRMSEERLNGLCLLHIHRGISIDVDKVLERLAKTKNRRLDLII